MISKRNLLNLSRCKKLKRINKVSRSYYKQRQDEFGETFFPTIVVSPDNVSISSWSRKSILPTDSKINEFFKEWLEECKPDTSQSFFPVSMLAPTINGVPDPNSKDIGNGVCVELEYSCCFKE